MGTTARTLVRGADTEQTIASLNSAYAYHLTAMHWTDAVTNRLHGPALLLLGAELEKVASDNLDSARAIASRVAELGGEIPANPDEFNELSPIDTFHLPGDLSDPKVIVGYALEQVRKILALYSDLLEQTRNTDDLSYQLVLHLLGTEISREDEMEGILT